MHTRAGAPSPASPMRIARWLVFRQRQGATALALATRTGPALPPRKPSPSEIRAGGSWADWGHGGSVRAACVWLSGAWHWGWRARRVLGVAAQKAPGLAQAPCEWPLCEWAAFGTSGWRKNTGLRGAAERAFAGLLRLSAGLQCAHSLS